MQITDYDEPRSMCHKVISQIELWEGLEEADARDRFAVLFGYKNYAGWAVDEFNDEDRRLLPALSGVNGYAIYQAMLIQKGLK